MTRKRKDSEVSSGPEMEKNREKMCEEKTSSWWEKSWSELRESFEKTQGFRLKDLTSFERFVRLMYRPTDPASLGMARALFGLCMAIDVVEERGLSDIDLKWGDPNGCHFPLIHGMERPHLATMIVLYAIMWMGAFGIMLGFCFKLACACFAIPYWYIFLLDKSFWNNHTYLYGIVAFLFWGTGANRYFALDAKISKQKDASVPLWNYFILRFQFFALYFIAGLKKSSREWLEGYAMTNLSRHWVFDPFTIFLSREQTDFLIVHWFGFVFDLTVGFWMLFPKTRIPAMVFCTAFHLMNSRLFSIGMFPYVCLATMPLFCSVDWPRKIIAWFTGSSIYVSSYETYGIGKKIAETEANSQNPAQNSNFNNQTDLCSENGEESAKVVEEKADEQELNSSSQNEASMENESKLQKVEPSNEKELQVDGEEEEAEEVEANDDWSEEDEQKVSAWRHKIGEKKKFQKTTKRKKIVVSLLLLHIALQFFLPYSHFITKGYNNWVPGLYGYSWDMMVHSWDTILVVIKVHDNVNNEDLFMNPQAWVQNDRWAKHGDMVRQHAQCLKDNLMRQKEKVLSSPQRSKDVEKWSKLSSNLSIYVDVWCSLNGRFQQRVFDPNVDMLTVDWSPFQPVSYLMPLLTQFSSYRYKLDEIQRHVHTWSNYTDVFFVADYPGMQLENYISNDFSNVSVSVLEGSVTYTEEGWKDKTPVTKGDWVPVKTGTFHTIRTTSSYPSCYMYTYTNQTEQDAKMSGSPKTLPRKNEALPIVKELKYKVNAWLRSLGHIANAFFCLVYDVPMVRRVRTY